MQIDKKMQNIQILCTFLFYLLFLLYLYCFFNILHANIELNLIKMYLIKVNIL